MKIKFALAALLLVSANGPRFTRTPAIHRNPNPSVPLAAVVEFEVDKPVRPRLLLNDGRVERTIDGWKSYDTQFSLPVLGLRPATKHTITLIVSDSDGNELKSTALEFTTDALPNDFPAIEATVTDPERMEPGVTLFDPFKPGNRNYGLLVAVDERGEVVWYYRSDENMSDVRRLQNGNLLFLDVTGASEIDMLGNVIQRWHPSALGKSGRGPSTPVKVDTFHHEIYEMPSSDFLVLSTELREAGVVDDVVTEFRRDGAIVNRWSLLDLLDPNRIGFGSTEGTWNETYPDAKGGTKDWAHSNAVIYDSRNDSVIVSMRHQDAIVKIDRKTDKLVWILGTPTGWNAPWNKYLLSPQGSLRWPYHQHAPKITPQGTILLFDNGENYSRAVEYAVDAKGMKVSEVWSYGGPRDEMFFSNALGDADWMPKTGNVLITDGSRVTPGAPAGRWARIVEVTHSQPAEKVFELVVRDRVGSDSSGWRVYRSERLSSLYHQDAVH